MLLLVTINLSTANIAAFDDYEAQVLPLLAQHHGELLHRLRAADDRTEFHLLQFPDAESLAAYQADPARTALAPLWQASGATAAITPVAPYP